MGPSDLEIPSDDDQGQRPAATPHAEGWPCQAGICLAVTNAATEEAGNEASRAFLYQAAEQDRDRATALMFAGWLIGALVLAGMMAAFLQLQPLWRGIFFLDAAALATYACGLVAARPVLRWRMSHAGLAPLPRPAYLAVPLALVDRIWNGPPEPESEDLPPGLVGRVMGAVGAYLLKPPLPLLTVALLAIILTAEGWIGVKPVLPAGGAGLFLAGMHAVLAYFYLVSERRLAGVPSAAWPEAPTLARLVRLPMLAFTAGAVVLLLADRGVSWAGTLLSATSVLVGLIALEVLLRAILSLFQPAGDSGPVFAANSGLSGLLHWPPRPTSLLQQELLDGFGIDLRQVWAFSFIRAALPKVVLSIAVVAWAFSGLMTVPLDARGIYEEFGQPRRVLQPGLHLGLPWPMSRVVPVENGAVHELATAAQLDGAPAGPADAEGPAPDRANRLWDGTHVSEKSQVIANGAGNGRSVEIVNMDVRFVYRTGLTDEAALNSAYRVADQGQVIESLANRALLHDFAAQTLENVLVSGRPDMAERLRRTVQSDLDHLQSGVELLAVVIEAIHPPAGAAAAYHSVQAAQIAAGGLIARERGAAEKQMSEARMQASLRLDAATAGARETLSSAAVTDRTFSAEQEAYRQAGPAFLTETYFSNLATGLARSRLLILDHRLSGQTPPLLDFRSKASAANPDVTALPDASATTDGGND